MKQGWEKKKLKDISYVIMGQSPSSTSYNDKEIGYPLLNGAADYKGQLFNPKKYTNAPTRLAEKNDILLGIRATIGNIAISDQTYCIGRGVAAIRVNEQKAHRNYIKNYLVSALDEIIGKSGGAIIKGIKKEDLTDMIIYLPDVNEQKRIVSKLDECFDAIDNAHANVERNLQNAKELFQSQLNQIFTQKGDGWVDEKLGEVCEEFGRGKSKHRPRNDKKLFDGDYPFVQTGDVRNAQKIITEYSQTYNEIGLAQSKQWRKGTVCITIAANIAETAILGFSACFPDSIIGFNADSSKTTNQYVYYLLQFYKEHLQKLGKGSAQDNINLGTFNKQLFPFPNLEIQKQIVNQLDDLKSQTQFLESNYQQELDALDELKKSILEKAFNGEL